MQTFLWRWVMYREKGIIDELNRNNSNNFFLDSAISELKSKLVILLFLREYLEYLKEVTKSEATAIQYMRIVLLHTLRSHFCKITKKQYNCWIDSWRLFSNSEDCFANT